MDIKSLGILWTIMNLIVDGQFIIKPLLANPGLYYEKLEDVQFKVGEWLVTTSITLYKPAQGPIDYESLCHQWNLLTYTGPPETPPEDLHKEDSYKHCNQAMGFHIIRRQQRELQLLDYNIQEFLKNTKTLQIDEDPNVGRPKRMIPFALTGEVITNLLNTITQKAFRRLAEYALEKGLDKVNPFKLNQETAHVVGNLVNPSNLEPDRMKLDYVIRVLNDANNTTISREKRYLELRTRVRDIKEELMIAIREKTAFLSILKDLHEKKINQQLLGPNV